MPINRESISLTDWWSWLQPGGDRAIAVCPLPGVFIDPRRFRGPAISGQGSPHLSFQDQGSDHGHKPRWNHTSWRPGQSGNPLGRRLGKEAEAARQAKVDTLIAALAIDYAPTQSQNELIVIAAGMIVDASLTRDTVRRARLANTANRILRGIAKRVPIAAKPPTIAAFEKQQQQSKKP
jgi:hypothetical protein